MSLVTTKEQLVQLLVDEDNKVIALSGKWGTGKSFMWEQVKQASQDEKVRSALYASLFGASSVEQVKLKLIQSARRSRSSRRPLASRPALISRPSDPMHPAAHHPAD